MPSKLKLLPDDIAERFQALPEKVVGVEGLIALWLFGSFARDEATPISDVDLAYLPDEKLTGDALERFETELYLTISGALRTDEFTFVNLRRAPTFFAWRVLAEGKLLFCRDELACAEVRETILQRFADCHPYQRERWQAVNDWLEGKPMQVDKGCVYALLEGIREEIGFLQEAIAMSREAYLEDKRTQRLIERCLQLTAEGGISIGNHFIARLGLRAPQDYSDVFQVLREAQILPHDLTEQMMDMAKFRNLLVHVYWAIDHERVYDSLPKRSEALEQFAKHIHPWFKEQP